MTAQEYRRPTKYNAYKSSLSREQQRAQTSAPLQIYALPTMPIIEVNHETKEDKPGQLTSLKHTALDDIDIGLSFERFCRSGFSRENKELMSDLSGIIGLLKRAPAAMMSGVAWLKPFRVRKCWIVSGNRSRDEIRVSNQWSKEGLIKCA